MSGLIERILRRLGRQLQGRISTPGDAGYAAATAIWAKPAGVMPRAVVHCRTPPDVQWAIRAARDCDVALSVRGGWQRTPRSRPPDAESQETQNFFHILAPMYFPFLAERAHRQLTNLFAIWGRSGCPDCRPSRTPAP